MEVLAESYEADDIASNYQVAFFFKHCFWMFYIYVCFMPL